MGAICQSCQYHLRHHSKQHLRQRPCIFCSRVSGGRGVCVVYFPLPRAPTHRTGRVGAVQKKMFSLETPTGRVFTFGNTNICQRELICKYLHLHMSAMLSYKSKPCTIIPNNLLIQSLLLKYSNGFQCAGGSLYTLPTCW